jgi:predicted HicB family RNase H-like nuclease
MPAYDTLTARVDPKVGKAFRTAAKDRRISLNALIELVLTEWLEERAS